MDETKDGLIICPCERKSNACYESQVTDDISIKTCLGCGFSTTNPLMKKGEEFYKEQIEKLPQLYKDLLFEDNDGLTWQPSVVNLPEKGMIYAEGTNKDNWKWVVKLAKPISEEEKEKFPVPGRVGEFYKFRLDPATTKYFNKHDYIDAIYYLENGK
jgi:hypothetical protein